MKRLQSYAVISNPLKSFIKRECLTLLVVVPAGKLGDAELLSSSVAPPVSFLRKIRVVSVHSANTCHVSLNVYLTSKINLVDLATHVECKRTSRVPLER